jgi:hypothetical protein
MTVWSYDLAQVNLVAVTAGGQTTATFASALKVRVLGFEPNELTNPDALGPLSSNISTPSGPRTTRVPTVIFSNPNISARPSSPFIDPDPTQPQPPVVSGVPVMYTFTYDLVFSNFDKIFPPATTTPGTPGVNGYSVSATFQVDATWTSSGVLELVDPCYDILQRLYAQVNELKRMPVTEVSGWEETLRLCYQAGRITEAEYTEAINAINTLGHGAPP